MFPVPFDGNTGLGHLHQRQAALLHPGSAGGGNDEQGKRLVHGEFHRERDHLTDRRAETAAQKTEVHHGHDEPVATDGSGAAQHRFGQIGLLSRRLPALGVRPGVGEPENVEVHGFDQQRLEASGVEELLDPLGCGQPVVVAAFGAHEQVAGQPFAVDERGAGSAPGPGNRAHLGDRGPHAASPADSVS